MQDSLQKKSPLPLRSDGSKLCFQRKWMLAWLFRDSSSQQSRSRNNSSECEEPRRRKENFVIFAIHSQPNMFPHTPLINFSTSCAPSDIRSCTVRRAKKTTLFLFHNVRLFLKRVERYFLMELSFAPPDSEEREPLHPSLRGSSCNTHSLNFGIPGLLATHRRAILALSTCWV